MKFIVIGITDNPTPYFPPEVKEIIAKGQLFSGGRRHHEIMSPLLPESSTWVDITAPLDAVFERYAQLAQSTTWQEAPPTVVVFASGDPLFFGFANTIRRKMPEAEVVTYPTFNSLQMLAHRLVMPYHNMRIVSLTGRPWHEFDRALIEHSAKIGVLTDHEHTPAAIAQRMLDYGYDNYTMVVGEHLGNPCQERVKSLSLKAASSSEFTTPNCLIITSKQERKPWFGIPDSAFEHLDGRAKMITKMPIRLLTLQALELTGRKVFWDIGFCTGSVSIEARRLFPHVHVEAFEIRPECEAIIKENARRFGTPGISVHMGDFLATDVTTIPRPDAVFIGGHGGKLKEIMAKVLTVLTADGVIVFNSVTSPAVHTDSRRLFEEACAELGLKQESAMRIVLDENNPIEIMKGKMIRGEELAVVEPQHTEN